MVGRWKLALQKIVMAIGKEVMSSEPTNSKIQKGYEILFETIAGHPHKERYTRAE